jgi:hypothetical protein
VLQFNVSCVTTITGAEALIEATGDEKIAGENHGQEFAGNSSAERDCQRNIN